MDHKLIDNQEKSRLELHIKEQVAFIDYKRKEDKIFFLHTEVPKALGGQGIGSYLAKSVLDFADTKGLTYKPYCPFIKAYIDRHPEYQQNSLFHNKDLSS